MQTSADLPVDSMSKDERRLLLFFEAAAVDRGGLVTGASMNETDHEIAKRWARDGFIRFSRIVSHLKSEADASRRFSLSHVVELTDAAFDAAAVERRRRARRAQSKIVGPSLRHFESQRAMIETSGGAV